MGGSMVDTHNNCIVLSNTLLTTVESLCHTLCQTGEIRGNMDKPQQNIAVVEYLVNFYYTYSEKLSQLSQKLSQSQIDVFIKTEASDSETETPMTEISGIIGRKQNVIKSEETADSDNTRSDFESQDDFDPDVNMSDMIKSQEGFISFKSRSKEFDNGESFEITINEEFRNDCCVDRSQQPPLFCDDSADSEQNETETLVLKRNSDEYSDNRSAKLKSNRRKKTVKKPQQSPKDGVSSNSDRVRTRKSSRQRNASRKLQESITAKDSVLLGKRFNVNKAPVGTALQVTTDGTAKDKTDMVANSEVLPDKSTTANETGARKSSSKSTAKSDIVTTLQLPTDETTANKTGAKKSTSKTGSNSVKNNSKKSNSSSGTGPKNNTVVTTEVDIMSIRNNAPNNLKPSDPSKPFECVICFKTFTVKRTMKTHMKVVHENSETACRKCFIVFKTEKGLENHIQTSKRHTELQLCNICGKFYSSPASLLKHKEIHTGARWKYKCTYNPCDKGFCNERLLEEHVNADHKLMFNFTCPKEGCSKRFRLRDTMQRHAKVCETGAICHICNKVFYSLSGMRDHINALHNNKVFGCDCGKQYSRRAALIKHQQKKKCTYLNNGSELDTTTNTTTTTEIYYSTNSNFSTYSVAQITEDHTKTTVTKSRASSNDNNDKDSSNNESYFKSGNAEFGPGSNYNNEDSSNNESYFKSGNAGFGAMKANTKVPNVENGILKSSKVVDSNNCEALINKKSQGVLNIVNNDVVSVSNNSTFSGSENNMVVELNGLNATGILNNATILSDNTGFLSNNAAMVACDNSSKAAANSKSLAAMNKDGLSLTVCSVNGNTELPVTNNTVFAVTNNPVLGLTTDSCIQVTDHLTLPINLSSNSTSNVHLVHTSGLSNTKYCTIENINVTPHLGLADSIDVNNGINGHSVMENLGITADNLVAVTEMEGITDNVTDMDSIGVTSNIGVTDNLGATDNVVVTETLVVMDGMCLTDGNLLAEHILN